MQFLCVVICALVTGFMKESLCLGKANVNDLSLEDVRTLLQQHSMLLQRQSAELQQQKVLIQQQETLLQQQTTLLQRHETLIQHHSMNIQELSAENQQQSELIQHQSALLSRQETAIQSLTSSFDRYATLTSRDVVKRGDDFMTNKEVLAITEQQASSILTLQAQVQALTAKITTNKQVAFHASFTTDTTNLDISANQPILFDHVAINLGNGYNSGTGMFTAPLSGLYAFFTTVREATNISGYVIIGLIASPSVQICQTVLEGSNNHMVWDKGSCFSPVHLNQGQQVHVQRIGGPGTAIDKGWQTGFSGFLLTAD